MLRHTLISNPLLSRATTKHICFDFSVSKSVRPVHFQSYSLFECAGGAGVCGRRPVIIFRCLVETGRTTRSGCRGACRKNGREWGEPIPKPLHLVVFIFSGQIYGRRKFFMISMPPSEEAVTQQHYGKLKFQALGRKLKYNIIYCNSLMVCSGHCVTQCSVCCCACPTPGVLRQLLAKKWKNKK